MPDKYSYIPVMLLGLLLGKLLFLPDPYTALALVAAILNYAFQGYQLTKSEKQLAFDEKIKEIEVKFMIVGQELELLKATQKLVAKQAEDTKKLISNSHLANAFVPRNKRQSHAES